jgi:hypothetical protein
MAYALAHKGKATAPEVTYNPTDEPEAYTNASVHSKLSELLNTTPKHRSPDESGRREATRPVLDGRQHSLLRLCSQPCRYSSKEHELLPSHTLSVAELTAVDGRTLGYYCFIRHSLLLHIYLAFALFKHCGWNVVGRLAEVRGPAGGPGRGPSARDGGCTSPEGGQGAEDAGHV